MRIVCRALILVICIIFIAIGAVHAQEYAEYKASQRWRVENPCFDWRGRWYTTGCEVTCIR